MTEPVHSVNIFFIVMFIAVTITIVTVLLNHIDK